MKHYINGNKIQMGFALSAYLDEEPQTRKTEEASNSDFKVLRPAIRFKNIENIVERNYGDYGFEAGCDDFQCEVEEGKEVSIYVNGDLVYGPIKGGNEIAIL